MNNDPLAIDKWLATLAVLLNPALPGDLREPLERLKPMLQASFNARLFTPLSAKSVAAAERFGPCPDWGVFEKTLTQYARDFMPRPKFARLYPPDHDYQRPEPEEIERVSARLQALAAEVRGGRPA
jgi:hypothetical protein